jgi:LAO/AO transport system kinase
MHEELLEKALRGDTKSIARCISLIENETRGFADILLALPASEHHKTIGITGAPGAGKSTLVDGLIRELVKENKRIAILCVDPSSPFNLGALLGDRVRMSEWYNHPDVFIRSLATRGSLGGLNLSILEITSLLHVCPFDYIIIETVGVGQSEVEIAGLADVTVVVMVPEGGDEVQTMKAGLMEVADIFVVNKSDRPGADMFVKNLILMLGPAFRENKTEVPVIKTSATQQQGLAELIEKIGNLLEETGKSNHKQLLLLAERAWHLIMKKRMRDVSKELLLEKIKLAVSAKSFSLYGFIEKYYGG